MELEGPPLMQGSPPPPGNYLSNGQLFLPASPPPHLRQVALQPDIVMQMPGDHLHFGHSGEEGIPRDRQSHLVPRNDICPGMVDAELLRASLALRETSDGQDMEVLQGTMHNLERAHLGLREHASELQHHLQSLQQMFGGESVQWRDAVGQMESKTGVWASQIYATVGDMKNDVLFLMQEWDKWSDSEPETLAGKMSVLWDQMSNMWVNMQALQVECVGAGEMRKVGEEIKGRLERVEVVSVHREELTVIFSQLEERFGGAVKVLRELQERHDRDGLRLERLEIGMGVANRQINALEESVRTLQWVDQSKQTTITPCQQEALQREMARTRQVCVEVAMKQDVIGADIEGVKQYLGGQGKHMEMLQGECAALKEKMHVLEGKEDMRALGAGALPQSHGDVGIIPRLVLPSFLKRDQAPLQSVPHVGSPHGPELVRGPGDDALGKSSSSGELLQRVEDVERTLKGLKQELLTEKERNNNLEGTMYDVQKTQMLSHNIDPTPWGMKPISAQTNDPTMRPPPLSSMAKQEAATGSGMENSFVRTHVMDKETSSMGFTSPRKAPRATGRMGVQGDIPPVAIWQQNMLAEQLLCRPMEGTGFMDPTTGATCNIQAVSPIAATSGTVWPSHVPEPYEHKPY